MERLYIGSLVKGISSKYLLISRLGRRHILYKNATIKFYVTNNNKGVVANSVGNLNLSHLF